MTFILDKIQNIITKAVHKITNEKINVTIEKIKNSQYGDYATNIAMVLVKKLQDKPENIAKKIIVLINNNEFFSKVEFAFPGFINLTISQQFISQVINNVLTLKDNFGRGKPTNIRYNLELVSANPTGFLHIGHARNAAISDSVSRILEFAGNDVETEYYINDAGNQIIVLANTIFVYYLKNFGIDINFAEESYQGIHQEQLAKKLVEKYQDKFIKVKFINNTISDSKVFEIFKKESVDYFLLNIKEQLKLFRVNIEHWSSEKDMYENKAVESLINKFKEVNKIYELEGAFWLKTTEYGDDKDRVLIKSDGTYTYIVPDLASHNLRLKRTKANYLINFWGGDHHGYISRLKAGLSILGYNPNVLQVIIIQMVRLLKNGKEYKMSKRKGTAIWLVDLIDELGVDTIRYMLCSKSASSHMELDVAVLLSNNSNNPVFYFQYATARCASILKKLSLLQDFSKNIDNYDLLTLPKERELLKIIDYFSKIVQLAARDKQPNIICEYIQELCRSFHSYYATYKIIVDDNIELMKQRGFLIKIIQQVLNNALNLISIKSKEEM